jgi:hypothetical protein
LDVPANADGPDEQTNARGARSVTRPIGLFVLVAVLTLGTHGVGAASTTSVAPATTGVFGEVLAKTTRGPVAGATVSLPALGRHTTTGPRGLFAFPGRVPTSAPYHRITVVVRAQGFGAWTVTGVPLYPNDPLHLHAELTAGAFRHAVQTPQERMAADRTGAAQAPSIDGLSGTSTCTGWSSQIVPPSTIAVYSTTQHTSSTYDFTFYLTHVLPDEWIASWDADALGAGAIAAKTYAWYKALPGHAYTGGAGCADITDYTGDQVFDPTWSNANTDQAVYATLGTVNWKNGGIWLSQYWSGSSTDPCQAVTGTYAGRMSQWGTQSCALTGMGWQSIVKIFYPDTNWLYSKNLLLDASIEDAQTYAWLTTQGGAYTRVSGGAYIGGWYLSTTKTTTIYQIRPWDGTPATTYSVSVALRCPTIYTSNCTPTIKVLANGTTVVLMQSLGLSVPHDGLWHLYSVKPPAAGIDHTSVQVNLVLHQNIGIDMATLTSAFGGP